MTTQGPNIVSRFDDLYNSTHKAALTFITAKCKRTADIADIFQDTYMELYQVLDKRGADYITNGKAFVLRLARQKLARHYSLADRLRGFVSLETADDDENAPADFIADDFILEDFIVDQDILSAVRDYIQAQPEAVQKVFYLFYEVGITIPEIAAALGISESNVKNEIYRTITKLRRLLT